ncbi:hypothetical protein GGTG_11428 [Gaeumannomyces tritici R3-111a-1]|uniref:Uncharacterized protein n=1 Tax=Gaeumannomyces tritici (strain R3-111a-1) TaxID=644352 RepID=J3PD59_GAET3|nr:hypothetical protein GGTG_11428 [Gaeumannomyces tritici R3-111a-1]EJT70404.1 hypothetical protein GGTG_11428 [Gaeumannomyces tritici R3-111a-1]
MVLTVWPLLPSGFAISKLDDHHNTRAADGIISFMSLEQPQDSGRSNSRQVYTPFTYLSTRHCLQDDDSTSGVGKVFKIQIGGRI